MKKSLHALITGASGFIGSHLAEYLNTRGWKVTCLLRPSSRTRGLSSLPVNLRRGDMTNPIFLEESVRNQDLIFHSAAQIRAAPPQIYHSANVILTENLVNACLAAGRRLKRFVFISSIASAGPSDSIHPKDESMPDSPASIYGRTKLLAEEIIKKSAAELPFTIIRPPNVYGPRQQETEWLIRLISAGILPLLRNSSARTSLIYIHDLVRWLEACALLPGTLGQTYYLTDGRPRRWEEIIESIKMLLKRDLFLPLPQGLLGGAAWMTDILRNIGVVQTMFGREALRNVFSISWLFSSGKAASEFGFRTSFSLEEGIRETLEYYGRKIRA